VKGAEANIAVVRSLDDVLLGVGVGQISEILAAPDPQRASEAFGDVYKAVLERVDPEIEVDLEHWGVKWPGSLRYAGLDGWVDFWREWLDPWDEFEFTRPRVEADEDWFVSEVLLETRGKGSGVPVNWRFFQLWRFREGRVFYLSTHPSWEAAIAATRKETA